MCHFACSLPAASSSAEILCFGFLRSVFGSIVFGDGMDGISKIKPGSITGIHLVVKDMDEARQALIDRGVEVGEVMDTQGVKYAGFSDPDGNGWVLQQWPEGFRR